jgi:hypothetical protein
MKKFYITGLLTLIIGSSIALQENADSATVIPEKKKGTRTFITRVHTMGLFLYMGKVVNNNPAADVYFNFVTPRGWGISVFKVVDLNDIHSHNNFAFVLISKTFHIGERLSIAPSVGAALEQQHSFANHGSDVLGMIATSYKLNNNFSVDHTALFSNLVFEPSATDWTNRFRVLFSEKHLDVTGLLWHNNRLFDKQNYLTTGLSIFYNRVPVAKKIFIGAGITGLLVAQASDAEHGPDKNGIQFTASITFK